MLFAKPLRYIIHHIPPTSRVRQGLIPETKRFIVIHNTGNYGTECNAQWHDRYIHAQAASDSPREASWHLSVDGREVYEHIPLYENAWHAGDGGRGDGNLFGIGIEICVEGFPGFCRDIKYYEWQERFLKAMDNAAVLTAALLGEYKLDISAVKQHYDFSPDRKNCPMQMRYCNETNDFSRTDGTLYNCFIKSVAGYIE